MSSQEVVVSVNSVGVVALAGTTLPESLLPEEDPEPPLPESLLPEEDPEPDDEPGLDIPESELDGEPVVPEDEPI